MYIYYKHRNFGLDVIRAVAIMLVIISHSTLLLFPNQNNTLLTIIRFFGTIGVDLFFVLSGFLIGRIILKQIETGKTTFKDLLYFWIRRWFRTLPNYFLILLLNIFLAIFLFKNLVKDIGCYFLFLQNFNSSQPDFFTESWSLSIEEYAYIIGPLLLYLSLIFFKKVQPKCLWYLLVVIIIIATSTYLKYNFYIQNQLISDVSWSHEFRKVVIYRIDSIYYGFLAAYIFMYFKSLWDLYKIKVFWLGSILFFGMHFLIFIFDFRPENAAFFYNIFYLSLVSVSLLLFFPFALTLKANSFIISIITKISVLSYAIYLINYSLVLLTIQFFIDVASLSIGLKILVLLLYLTLTYLASLFLYICFEKPTTNMRDSAYIKQRFHIDSY